jgi:hypothetical protein
MGKKFLVDTKPQDGASAGDDRMSKDSARFNWLKNFLNPPILFL